MTLTRRGFRFAETMSGTYARLDSPSDERRFSFTVEARADSVTRHLRNGRAALSGVVEAEGLAAQAPLEGALTLSPVSGRFIRYEFQFTGDDGKPYRFSGQKTLSLLSPLKSSTTLPGALYDGRGTQIATCLTRFDLKGDLLPFLASWRPA